MKRKRQKRHARTTDDGYESPTIRLTTQNKKGPFLLFKKNGTQRNLRALLPSSLGLNLPCNTIPTDQAQRL
jgi:hypothetical protein